jgi:diadenylate cyclase
VVTYVSDLGIDLTLRLRSLNWLDWLDLALVAIVFFVLVAALERVQARFMLRGISVIAVTLLITAFLLPLPAFALLAQVILIFLLITVPIVFQRELRRLLEKVGRAIGLSANLQLEPEEVVQPVMRAVERMSADHIGALIVLEGEINLEEIAQTGVAIGSNVSTELLRAIFYPNNPLHDGAVLIRGGKIIAAGCVLPITRQNMARQRLGTRHRAALGLVERTDALVAVVSEETGRVSVAEGGQLHRLADADDLRDHIVRFTQQASQEREAEPVLHHLFDRANQQLGPGFVRRLRRTASSLGLALLFALMLWWFVLVSARPLPNLEIRDVPLQIEGERPELILAQGVPATVDLVVRTVGDNAALLDEGAFVATLSLEGLGEGVHEVPVEVLPRVDVPVQILGVEPESVVVDLAVMARRTISITLLLTDAQQMPAGFEVRNEPVVEPVNVLMEGPQPLVERVAEVQAALSLAGARAALERTVALAALDAEGNEVDEVVLYPPEVTVRLDVERQPGTREAGIAIVVEGEPAPGYWISGLSSQPGTIVLDGPPAALAAIRASVATLPVNVSGAVGDVSVDVPLDLPPDISAQTVDGESVASVRVNVRISAIRGFMTVSRPVEFFGATTEPDVIITPAEVDVLLEGPILTLEEIERDPTLVRVVVQGINVPRGSSVEQAVQVVVPEGIRAQPVPARVTISRR